MYLQPEIIMKSFKYVQYASLIIYSLARTHTHTYTHTVTYICTYRWRASSWWLISNAGSGTSRRKIRATYHRVSTIWSIILRRCLPTNIHSQTGPLLHGHFVVVTMVTNIVVVVIGVRRRVIVVTRPVVVVVRMRVPTPEFSLWGGRRGLVHTRGPMGWESLVVRWGIADTTRVVWVATVRGGTIVIRALGDKVSKKSVR